jgi:hypothetical protein
MIPVRYVIAVAALHLGAFAYFLGFMLLKGYLPQPYVYDSFDTFMDFFHTNYWAHQDGRYTEWRSIYPAFTFFVAQLISPAECYVLDAFSGRDCDRVSLVILLGASLIAASMNAKLFSTDRVAQFVFFLAIVFSFPFLMALERGNYVLLAYAFLVFAATTRSQVAEGILLACAINLKQYLLPLLGCVWLCRKYAAVAACLVAAVFLNLIAIVYLPEPWFLLLLDNMFTFVDPDVVGLYARIAYTMSVNAFVSFAQVPRATFIMEGLGLPSANLILFAQILRYLVVAVVLFVFYHLVKARTELNQAFLSYATLVCLFNLTDTPGIYALILLLPYLPAAYPMLWRRELVALLILFLPIDASFFDILDYTDGDSYLTGEIVTHSYGLMYGSVYRPVAMLALLMFIAHRFWSQRTTQAGAAEPRPALAGRTS